MIPLPSLAVCVAVVGEGVLMAAETSLGPLYEAMMIFAVFIFSVIFIE